MFFYQQGSLVRSKPLDLSTNNEINDDEVKNPAAEELIDQNISTTLDRDLKNGKPVSTENFEKDKEDDDQNFEFSGNFTPKPQGWLSLVLKPLIQRVQVSSQSFLQDKISQLQQTLNSLGLSSSKNDTGKQLDTFGGLVHLTGPYDPDFYTNRLEQAGFFGGNGWFANKGGILGGPGALLSTGSVLTDYPSAYKK